MGTAAAAGWSCVVESVPMATGTSVVAVSAMTGLNVILRRRGGDFVTSEAQSEGVEGRRGTPGEVIV